MVGRVWWAVGGGPCVVDSGGGQWWWAVCGGRLVAGDGWWAVCGSCGQWMQQQESDEQLSKIHMGLTGLPDGLNFFDTYYRLKLGFSIS